MTTTMKAIRFHEYGDSGVLHYEDVPRPEAKSGEVLIRVHATSVNPLDWKIREGHMKDMMPISFPFIPGGDVSGVVEAVGADVLDFAPGDAVFGRISPQSGGAYAEYAVTSATLLSLKPDALSFAEVASVPVVALTAWQGLFRFGGLGAGQSVLIHGAAGGVGLFAVQFARWKGASSIYATESAEDTAFVKSLGATTVIDYHAQKFEEVAKEVDVVLDLIGGETQERSWGVLKPGGILVASTEPPSPEKAAAHGVRAAMIQVAPSHDLNEIATLLTNGTVKTEIGKIFPLAEARAAQELSQHGHVRGKIVLSVA